MFFHLLFIHLFRPFLKYHQANSPLPANISPRNKCIHAAATISKLLRIYKRAYGLRQICSTAVYIAHSACIIHLLTFPEESARVNLIHGVKHLEEIAESWLCARRALHMLKVLARQWEIPLPEEAAVVLKRVAVKLGFIKPQGPEHSESEVSSSMTLQSMTSTTGSNTLSSEVMELPLGKILDLNSSAYKTQRDLWEQDKVQRSATRQGRSFQSVTHSPWAMKL